MDPELTDADRVDDSSTADWFSRSAVSMVVVDMAGRIIASNRAARRLLDTRESRLTDRPLFSFVDELEHEALKAELVDALRDPNGDPTRRRLTLHLTTERTITADLYVNALGADRIGVQIVVVPPDSSAETALAQQRAFRTALMELGELSHQHIEDADFYDTLLRRAVDVVPGAQAGSILVRRPGTDEFHFVAAAGFDLAGLQTRHLVVEQMFRDVDTPSASINRDLSTDGLPEEQAEWLHRVGRVHEIVTNVAAPVFAGGEAMAFISLDNFEDRRAFDSTSVEMTTMLGRLIADLLRRRDLEAELRRERESFRHLALHDGLTGLPNRRQLEARLLEHMGTANHGDSSLALFFVDLDDFKTINDALGHDGGDRVLVAVADALRHAMREGDIVGRWGGDEFVVIAPGVGLPEHATELAERIVGRFERPLVLPTGREVTCRLSIGVAWTDDGSIGTTALMNRADAALYAAKMAGKSAVRLDAG